MYKTFTQIHLNYKFEKIMLKNIYIHRLSDCLANSKKVKILDGMKFSSTCSSGNIIMLFLLSYEVHIMLNKSI